MPRLPFATGCCLIFFFLLPPRPAAAIQLGRLGVYPSGGAESTTPWFRYHLGLGQSQRGTVTVDNRSAASVTVRLYAVDGAPTGDGGFGMEP